MDIKASKELQRVKDQIVGHDSVFDLVPTLVYTKNKKLSFTFINISYLELLKKEKSSVVGKTSFSLFSLDEAVVIDQLERKVLEGNRVRGVEVAVPGMRNTKGLFYGQPIVDDKTNRIVGITVAIEDMTPYLNVLNKHKMLEKAVDYSQDVFWVKRPFPEVKLEYISHNVCEFAGYETEQFFSKPAFWVDNVVHPEDVERVIEYYRNGKYSLPVEYRIVTSDGQAKHVTESLFKVEESNLVYGIIQNIERQREQEQLHAIFEDIIDKLPHIVWVYKRSTGQLIYVSEEVKNLLGMMPKSFMKGNKKFIDIVHSKDRKRVEEWLHDEKSKNVTGTIKHRIITRDEKVRWVRNKKYLSSQVDNTDIICGILEDITDEMA